MSLPPPSSSSALVQRLRAREFVLAPGVYDALSAALVERAGFCAAYLSGASLAYTRLGRPDIGLPGLTELADTLANIRERVELSLIVDADTGFGNAINVQRTIRLLESRGATAVQLEDQQSPKRCGHLAGKSVIGWREMTGKLRAACDARRSTDTLLVARTDALAIEGLDAALERAERYLEAGADVLFVEALPDESAMRQTLARFAGRVPVLANVVEGGRSPCLPAAELEAMGFALAIFPGSLVRMQTAAAIACLEALQRDGSTAAVRERMLDFRQLNALLGTEVLLETGKRYDDAP